MALSKRSVPARTLMNAAVLTNPGEVRIKRLALPQPGPGQVRVALEGCGVCASNLPPWEGREWFTYPMAPGQLGHEGWGVIDKLGPGVEGVEAGTRVAMLSQSAYADYDVADVTAVVPLPNRLAGVAVPAEPLGCAMNVFERSGIRPGQTVAIVGIGFLGAILTQLVSRTGARVLAISRRAFSLEVAARCGASECIAMDDHWRIIEAVKSLTEGRLCDVVIEAVGLQWPLDLSGELARERGRLVVAGYHQDGLRQVNMQLWNWRGLDVINAHERDPARYTDGIRRGIRAIMKRKVDLSELITHEYPLERLGEALEDTRRRPDGFLKAIVRPSGWNGEGGVSA